MEGITYGKGYGEKSIKLTQKGTILRFFWTISSQKQRAKSTVVFLEQILSKRAIDGLIQADSLAELCFSKPKYPSYEEKNRLRSFGENSISTSRGVKLF